MSRFGQMLFRSRSVTSTRRKHSLWTNDKVVKSPCKDIDIPNVDFISYFNSKIENWPTKTALVCGVTNKTYTYEELHRKIQVFAAHLKKTFGINKGDVVSIYMFNSIEYPIAFMGVLAAGGIPSTLNPLSTEYEIERLIAIAGSKLTIVSADLVNVMRTALKNGKSEAKIISVAVNCEVPENTASFLELIDDNHIDTSILKSVVVGHDDVCLLPFSSGTTGFPKGVQISHRNIIANCLQQSVELRQYEYTTDNYQENVLAVLPFFHSYGLSMIMLHKLSEGLRMVVLPAFKPETFTKSLTKYRINLLYAAPPMMMYMVNQQDVTAKHFEHINCIVCGAAPLPSGDIEKLFDKAGRQLDFLQGYGLTETGPLATISPRGCKDYVSVGLALSRVELRVVDEHFNNLGANEVGELLIKGPNVMKGYLNPNDDKDVLLKDGWLRSGDMARINEDGFVYITERLKELIKVKGYQVPPAELESVLKRHSDVFDAAVIGVPDSKTGEVPVGFVVLKNERMASKKLILDFVNEKVAPYKKIKDITFIDAIPRNPSGKILRKILREKYC